MLYPGRYTSSLIIGMGPYGRFRIPVLDNTRVTQEQLPSQPSNKWGVKTWVREHVLVSVLDIRDRRSRVRSTRVLSRTGIRKRPMCQQMDFLVR
jgi:hypothetical protein